MNFVGTGKRFTQGDIGEAARIIKVETAVLLAFIEVETAGRGFDNRNRLKMLRETHIFYRELGPGAERNKAVSQGLANENWKRNYKSDSYPDLERMMKINKNAAIRSASWALPQILGNNCKASGFASAELMVKTMMQGEREQLIALVTLLAAWGLDKKLRGRDFSKAASWADIAERYNGPAYKKHNYHGRMATAYVKHARGTKTPMKTIADKNEPVLRHGMKGEAVLNLQNDLAYLGYEFKLGIDGRYGNETERNVTSFQNDYGVTPRDGIAGKKTRDAIAEAIKHAKADKTPQPPEWREQSATGGLLASLIAVILAFFKQG